VTQFRIHRLQEMAWFNFFNGCRRGSLLMERHHRSEVKVNLDELYNNKLLSR